MYEHSLLIKNKLEEMGASDLMIITENVEAPKLTFKLDNVTYTTDCLSDFTYDVVMKNIYEKLKNYLKKFTIIVATSQDGVIGNKNSLPWHVPKDLKRFKEITWGHTIIMGKNTFKSIPNAPLRGRRNIVITSDINIRKISGIEIASSIGAAINLAQEGENFIIGGGEIYRQFLPRVNKILLTIIKGDYNGDTYFDIDYDEWNIVDRCDGGEDVEYLTLMRKVNGGNCECKSQVYWK